jgi:hypothetical protein
MKMYPVGNFCREGWGPTQKVPGRERRAPAVGYKVSRKAVSLKARLVSRHVARGRRCALRLGRPMKARHGPPRVGTMSWASRAALGAGGRMTPMGQFINEMRDLAEPKREGLRDGANGGSADSEEGEKRGADHVARGARAFSVGSRPPV